MNIYFMSLGSGSSGNCYYLGTDTYGILIDAGVGIRAIKKTFKEYGLDLNAVKALFITHDHADHIKAAGHLANKYHIPLYTTPQVHAGISRNRGITQKPDPAQARHITKEETVQVGDFAVTCFEVPHDGTDNVGYSIGVDGRTIAFLTDIGHITPTAARYIHQANYLVLEANYDEAMLLSGPYPPHLKDRIASPCGHLSNQDMARHLALHFPPALRHLWLCHLSQDNNRPELALKTLEQTLAERGIIVGKDLQATALRRAAASPLYKLE